MINVLRLLCLPVAFLAGVLAEHYRPLGTAWQSNNAVKLANRMAFMDAARCCHD